MDWQSTNSGTKPTVIDDEITMSGPGECTLNPYVNSVLLKDADTGTYFPLKYCTVYNGNNTHTKY